jgi:predicted metalloprotease
MRWKTGRRSSNVEDRRGQGGGGLGGFGFPMPRLPRAGLPGGMRAGMPGGVRGGGIGCLGILLLIVVFMVLFKLGPFGPSGTEVSSVPSSTSLGPGGSAPQDELADFVSVVLADTEDTWRAILPSAGVAYEEPVLVLYSGYTQTACGLGQSATGPFYCPLDRKLYIDLSFYDELRTRFGAPGDFAQAYVITHEVGHHVQTLLGISQEVDAARRRSSQVQANELSVRLELQADCLSGIWAHHAQRERQILEEGDIEEGLAAAAAIGDDRIQRQTQGHVVPDSFTHGSSQQRVRWFRRGFETGDLGTCDTFSATDL